MAKPIFTIDSVKFTKESEYDKPGIWYQISSEDNGIIRGFIACRNIAVGREELEFQLSEFNARLNGPRRPWETRSHSKNAPMHHRANRAQRRRLENAANH